MNESSQVPRESWQQLGKNQRCIVGSEGCCSRDTSLRTLWGQKPCTFAFGNFNSFKMFFQQSQCEGPRRIHRMKRKVVALFFCPEPCLGLGLAHLVHSQGDISDILRYLLRRRMAIKCQGLQFSGKNCCIRRGFFESTICSVPTTINGLSCRSWILIGFLDSHKGKQRCICEPAVVSWVFVPGT